MPHETRPYYPARTGHHFHRRSIAAAADVDISTSTDYQVDTAEITAVEFYTGSGLLLFTVEGQRIAYSSYAGSANNYAAPVAASFATLVRFSTDLNNPGRTNNIDSTIFRYDFLKP